MRMVIPCLCLPLLAAIPATAQSIDGSKPLTNCDLQRAFSRTLDVACLTSRPATVPPPQGTVIDPGEEMAVGIDYGPKQAPDGRAGGFVENQPVGITFPSVTFASGSARVSGAAAANLEKIGDYLAMNPGLKLEIGGHTDAAGTDAANKVLSQRRAGAVMTLMIRRGASESQFLPVGYGEERLLPDQPCVAEKQRRVELHVVDTNPWKAPAGPPRFCD